AGSQDVTISVNPDSDIRLREKPSGGKTPDSATAKPGSKAQPPTSDPGKRGKHGPRSPKPAADSGVRLVPMDSDSDVKIASGGDDAVPLGEQPGATLADSNVKLEKVAFPPQPEDAGTMLTDEINLDEELKKEEQRKKKSELKSARPK